MIYPRPWMKKGRDKICPICKNVFYVPLCRERVFTCSKVCGYEFRKRFTLTRKWGDKTIKTKMIRWESRRKVILDRDIYCCLCGNNGKDVHHKVPYFMTGNNAEDNLVLLCKPCHRQVHKMIRKGKELGYNLVSPDEEGVVLLLERGLV